jgi:hypothetical protein
MDAAGLALNQPGDLAISLGTSDTVFGVTKDLHPGLEGHVFPNPVDPESYMAMLCYKKSETAVQMGHGRPLVTFWRRLILTTGARWASTTRTLKFCHHCLVCCIWFSLSCLDVLAGARDFIFHP